MGDPHIHKPTDAQGRVIDDRDWQAFAGNSVQAPMPPSIAKALVAAAKAVKECPKSGTGNDARTGEEFRYATIDDILGAGRNAMLDSGIMPYPMKVHYELNEHVGTLWAEYAYQFRIVHEDGSIWHDRGDTRHVTLPVVGGQTEGIAQSYALKHWMRGLLMIVTGERDADAEGLQVQAPPKQQGSPQSAAERIKRRASAPAAKTSSGPTYNFNFGRTGSGTENVSAAQALQNVQELIVPYPKEFRQDWLEHNARPMKELCDAERAQWLKIMRLLDVD